VKESAMKRDTEKTKQWEAVLGEQEQSGLSARAFCRQRQIGEWQFYYWRRQLRGPARPRPDAGGETGTGFVELVSRDAGCDLGAAGVAIRLGGGRSIVVGRGFDPDVLRQVLTVVGESLS